MPEPPKRSRPVPPPIIPSKEYCVDEPPPTLDPPRRSLLVLTGPPRRSFVYWEVFAPVEAVTLLVSPPNKSRPVSSKLVGFCYASFVGGPPMSSRLSTLSATGCSGSAVTGAFGSS